MPSSLYWQSDEQHLKWSLNIRREADAVFYIKNDRPSLVEARRGILRRREFSEGMLYSTGLQFHTPNAHLEVRGTPPESGSGLNISKS